MSSNISELNFSVFIAKRISIRKRKKKELSDSILKIAVSVVAVGIAVMIITISVVTGFKKEIYRKIVGFQAHITIKNRDINETFETKPISINQRFYPNIKSKQGIEHIQVYATKPGIIKTTSEVNGIILKGLSTDFKSDFLEENLTDGKLLNISSEKKENQILISKKTADLLNYKLGDKVNIFFIQDPPKARSLKVSGIYNTGMEELDKTIAFCDIRHIQSINDWNDDQISGFEIFINDFQSPEQMTQIVEDEVSGIINNEGGMLEVSNYLKDNEFIVHWLRLSDTNVYVILTLMIIVAMLSMIAALLVIILERTGMIGILKSLGAENKKIVSIFVYNGSFLIFKGLIVGNFIGLALLFLQKNFNIIPLDPKLYYVNSVPVSFDLINILLLNLGTLLVSSLVLILPALMASKISPAKTINFK